jgi:hypothetical protein
MKPTAKFTAFCFVAQDFLWILPVTHCPIGMNTLGFSPQVGAQENR